MIHCTNCGKPIEKVPSWLQGAKVTFVCNNCPNRQAKNIAFMQHEFEPKVAKVEEIELDDADADAEVD